MLKQILITSALLLGSTSQLSASQCATYGSEKGEVSGQDEYFFFVL
jgi:hypothetical protein